MPTGNDTTTPAPEDTQDVKWFGEEEIFSIGSRPVKIWELIVGLIILSMLLPLLLRGGSRRGSGATTSTKEGATIVNVKQTGTRKVYQRRKKKKK